MESPTGGVEIAGSDVHIYTLDAAPTGGPAHFFSYGEIVMACDIDPDGWWVNVKLFRDSPLALLAAVTDTNGAATGCGEVDLEIPEGTVVLLAVTLTRWGELRGFNWRNGIA